MSHRLYSIILVVVLVGCTLAAGGYACGGRRVRHDTPTYTLVQSLSSPRAHERRRAAEMLGRRRDPSATQPLLYTLSIERHEGVIMAILYALAFIGAPEAQPVLQGHLSHPSPRVARAAQRALMYYDQYRPYYGRPLPYPSAQGTPQPVPPPPAQPPEEGEVEYE